MGHISNVYSNRLGLSMTWRNKVIICSSENVSSSNFYNELNLFLEKLFRYNRNYRKGRQHILPKGSVYSHFLLCSQNGNLVVQLFIYNRFFFLMCKRFICYLLFNRKWLANKHLFIARRFFLNFMSLLMKRDWRTSSRVLFFRVEEILRVYYRRYFYYFYIKFLERRFRSLDWCGGNLKFDMVPMYNFQIFNINTVTRYMQRGFRYVSMFRVVRPMFSKLKKRFKGVRLECSGRFTRRQRATFLRFSYGSVPLGTFSKPISYNYFSIPLKYGVGTIKIWLHGFKRPKCKSSIRFFGGSIIDHTVSQVLKKSNLRVSNKGNFEFRLRNCYAYIQRYHLSGVRKRCVRLSRQNYGNLLDRYNRYLKISNFFSNREKRLKKLNTRMFKSFVNFGFLPSSKLFFPRFPFRGVNRSAIISSFYRTFYLYLRRYRLNKFYDFRSFFYFYFLKHRNILSYLRKMSFLRCKFGGSKLLGKQNRFFLVNASKVSKNDQKTIKRIYN